MYSTGSPGRSVGRSVGFTRFHSYVAKVRGRTCQNRDIIVHPRLAVARSSRSLACAESDMELPAAAAGEAPVEGTTSTPAHAAKTAKVAAHWTGQHLGAEFIGTVALDEKKFGKGKEISVKLRRNA
eukprot:5034834-Prymnesium_polylepis.1